MNPTPTNLSQSVNVNVTVPEPEFTLTQAISIMPLLPQLSIFGLISHLVLTIFGAQIEVSSIPAFVFELFFPYLGKKTGQSLTLKNNKTTNLSFVTLKVYETSNTPKKVYQTTTNILGEYQLKTFETNNLLIKTSHPGFIALEQSVYSPNHKLNPIILTKKERLNHIENLRLFCLQVRFVPLLLALIASLLSIIITRDLFSFIYLLISLNLIYTQLVYPRLTPKLV